MIFRAVDIETIPDLSVWDPGAPQYQLTEALTGASSAGVKRADPFPPPHAHRIVAIATADIEMQVSGEPRYKYVGCSTSCKWSHPENDDADLLEALLLRQFADSVTSIEGSFSLITWNGRGFDLPVMSMRALKLGVPWGWYYQNRDMRYRFSTDGHLDLMDFLGDYGAARNMKLGDVARLIGLPGKTGEVSGGNVSEIVSKSKLGSREEAEEAMGMVGRYCLSDALQTVLIFLRSRFHLGKIDLKDYNRALDFFAVDESVRAVLSVNWDKLKL